jgi:hypothetical protein
MLASIVDRWDQGGSDFITVKKGKVGSYMLENSETQ